MIFITGQSGPQKRSIKISFNWDPHGAITVHTCTCEMILPIAINNYEDFRTALDAVSGGSKFNTV